MKEKLKTKSAGFYFAALAAAAAVVSAIRFLLWAPKHNGMDAVILAALAAGIVLDIVLMIRDNDYLIVLSTVCYSVATVKLLTNSVGSFVDAFQGINMFGDAVQVNTIVSIAVIMGLCVLFSIIAAFLKRVKEQERT